LPLGSVIIKAGHVQPVWAGHPWVFAQAIERIEGGVSAGDEVLVRDGRGNALGRGLYSPGSAIPVRLYTRNPDQPVDHELFAQRIAAAVERRRAFELPGPGTTGYRLIHAEGDDLPGLVVDRLGNTLAVQFGTIGIKQREAEILDVLTRLLSPSSIVDRSSTRTAEAEGFRAASGVVRGAPLEFFEFEERGFAFRIPLELGQKTGFYFDQRPLRTRIEALARGRRVLDAYTYVGSIALSAARGGATEVEAIDSSALSLEVAAELLVQNGLAGRVKFERGDAISALSHAGRSGGFELVICDPPKFAPTRAARTRALESMRRLAAAGCRATKPFGLLVVSSCSAAVGLYDLTRAIALGARDVGTSARTLERVFQGPDHPVPAAFAEGLYLTTLIVEVRPA
jgi:23S rRNA (cytosine1962-C5)-methyltransferase